MKDSQTTVVVPVRNGGATLTRVLDGLVNQSLAASKIIVSDNQSSDDTHEIALAYAARHPSISVVKQPTLLPAILHFRTVYEMVDTPFFMWAAHDDFHSNDYIERLVPALVEDDDLIAAFGDLVIFNEDDDDVATKAPLPLPCDTRGLTFRQRLRIIPERHVSMSIYGVWRTEALAAYRWYAPAVAEDWILMWFAMGRGDIAHVPGPRFYYYVPAMPKSAAERARNDAYRDVDRTTWLRVYLAGARAAVGGAAARGRRHNAAAAFLEIALSHRKVLVKQLLYRAASGRPWQRRRSA